MSQINFKTLIAGIAIIIGVVCYIPYIRDIYRGKTKPHTISWLIRTLTTGLGFRAQIQDGVGWGAGTLGAFALMNCSIFVYALRKGETSITILDYIAGGLAVGALIVRRGMKDPLRSVILISIADSLGFYPTFHKSYHEPQSESLSFWILTITSLILSFFAMQHISFIGTFYTSTMLFRETLLVALILIKKKQKLNHS